MEQRDLLKDQIEQLGKVLANILSDLLGLKSKGQTSQGIEATNQRLQGELDIDIEKITTLTKKELKDYLKNRHLRAEHLEILSECLKEIGKGKIEENKKDAKMKLEKAIELLDIADEISKTMSFDRINKKKEIENVLQQRI
ncbi:MAG: hypothetical protein GX163_00985 [Bacteroidetes bacterium]|jgi:hypothetical protein|nr:hypothetical protein [Bacteroidota bacterium]